MRTPAGWVRQHRALTLDILLALAVAAAQLLQLAALVLGSNETTGVWRPLSVVGVLLVLGQALPLILRRRYPTAVFAVVLVATVSYYLADYPATDLDFPAMVALFSVAAYRRLRTSLIAAGLVVAAVAVVYVVNFGLSVRWGTVVFVIYYLGLQGAAWAGGRYQQTLRRLRAAKAAEQAAAALRVEHDRQVQTEQVLAAERARIARELHDSVAHHLSVMMMQTGGARRLLDIDPERVRTALRVVENAGKRAMTAMPSLIRALRMGDQYDGAARPPGLADLPALITDVTAAGLPITLAVHGQPRPLPPGVDLSAYRVVQEALTNTLKHAGPARAVVDVRYEPHTVEVEVTDDGFGAARHNGNIGHGLLGMRERVAVFGGSFDAGSCREHGFRVRARFPADSS